ncbi:MAG: NUDIX domain-containing protein [Bacilli bacterium]|nr:NUDIX domain-containing protein [Bacilli bacterium]
MSKVKKAGCVLVNTKEKTIALVYREKQKDYSFPKGHAEGNETLEECAIRETAEETKRDSALLEKEPIYIEQYVTPSGEDVEMYYYLAKDMGPSANTSDDTHPTFWIPFEEVHDTLSYPSLQTVWNSVKDKVQSYFE